MFAVWPLQRIIFRTTHNTFSTPPQHAVTIDDLTCYLSECTGPASGTYYLSSTPPTGLEHSWMDFFAPNSADTDLIFCSPAIKIPHDFIHLSIYIYIHVLVLCVTCMYKYMYLWCELFRNGFLMLKLPSHCPHLVRGICRSHLSASDSEYDTWTLKVPW